MKKILSRFVFACVCDVILQSAWTIDININNLFVVNYSCSILYVFILYTSILCHSYAKERQKTRDVLKQLQLENFVPATACYMKRVTNFPCREMGSISCAN